jgi:hypothetical protein
MVVANSDEPVFYSENTYWLYRDRAWYRSSSHRSGWSRVDQPPEHVRRIARPEAFVHYRRDAATRTTYNEHQPPRPAPARAAPERRPPAPPSPDDAPLEQPPVVPSANPVERGPLSPRQPDQLRPEPVAPAPGTEPNPQGPKQPYANPLPPQQVPPADAERHGVSRQIPDPGAPIAPERDRRPPDIH